MLRHKEVVHTRIIREHLIHKIKEDLVEVEAEEILAEEVEDQ
jgi:hypothetical protein